MLTLTTTTAPETSFKRVSEGQSFYLDVFPFFSFLSLILLYILWTEGEKNKPRYTQLQLSAIKKSESRVKCWSWFALAYESHLCSSFPNCVQWSHFSGLKSSTVGGFTPQKLANITDLASISPGEPVFKHLPAYSWHVSQCRPTEAV